MLNHEDLQYSHHGVPFQIPQRTLLKEDIGLCRTIRSRNYGGPKCTNLVYEHYGLPSCRNIEGSGQCFV